MASLSHLRPPRFSASSRPSGFSLISSFSIWPFSLYLHVAVLCLLSLPPSGLSARFLCLAFLSHLPYVIRPHNFSPPSGLSLSFPLYHQTLQFLPSIWPFSHLLSTIRLHSFCPPSGLSPISPPPSGFTVSALHLAFLPSPLHHQASQFLPSIWPFSHLSSTIRLHSLCPPSGLAIYLLSLLSPLCHFLLSLPSDLSLISLHFWFSPSSGLSLLHLASLSSPPLSGLSVSLLHLSSTHVLHLFPSSVWSLPPAPTPPCCLSSPPCPSGLSNSLLYLALYLPLVHLASVSPSSPCLLLH